MQEIRISNTPVVTGICDPNKSRARHHRSFVRAARAPESVLTQDSFLNY